MKKINIMALTSTLLTSPFQLSSAQTSLYKMIKNNINSLENKIIKDVEFNLPAEYHKMPYSPVKQISLSKKLEEEFQSQSNLFYSISEELKNIKTDIKKYTYGNELNKEEVKSLYNNIEYTKRIILNTRQSEINALYHKLKKELFHHPKLAEIYQKLKQAKLPGNCLIQDISYLPESGTLSFNITKSQTIKSHFILTEKDFNNRSISSIYKHTPQLASHHNIETSFKKFNPDSSFSRMLLIESNEGDILSAGFYRDQKPVPLINFAGLSFGEKKKDEHIECSSQ